MCDNIFRAMASTGFSAQKFEQLEEFVRLCKSSPDVLNSSQLKFVRDWIERCVLYVADGPQRLAAKY